MSKPIPVFEAGKFDTNGATHIRVNGHVIELSGTIGDGGIITRRPGSKMLSADISTQAKCAICGAGLGSYPRSEKRYCGKACGYKAHYLRKKARPQSSSTHTPPVAVAKQGA